MGSTASRIASIANAAFYGALLAYIAFRLAGMREAASDLLPVGCVLVGVQIGALLYDKRNGGDCR